ncbi:hypothetical protein PM8797T_28019 [Gimesia maris DSM 8797]|nr:hypothetical protein PM8797T_28019 [Gimesia maris DSM 8797]
MTIFTSAEQLTSFTGSPIFPLSWNLKQFCHFSVLNGLKPLTPLPKISAFNKNLNQKTPSGVPVFKPWKTAQPTKLQPFRPAQPAKIVMTSRK